MSTLIIIEGSRYLHCGDVKVVGADWVHFNDLPMSICCDCNSAMYVYEEIPFSVFRYCLSRMRSPVKDNQKRHDFAGVFVNLEDIWFGRARVWNWQQDQIDLELLEKQWGEYWNRGYAA